MKSSPNPREGIARFFWSFREFIACYDTVVTRLSVTSSLFLASSFSDDPPPQPATASLEAFNIHVVARKPLFHRNVFADPPFFCIIYSSRQRKVKGTVVIFPKCVFSHILIVRKRTTGWFQLTKKHRATSIHDKFILPIIYLISNLINNT